MVCVIAWLVPKPPAGTKISRWEKKPAFVGKFDCKLVKYALWINGQICINDSANIQVFIKHMKNWSFETFENDP